MTTGLKVKRSYASFSYSSISKQRILRDYGLPNPLENLYQKRKARFAKMENGKKYKEVKTQIWKADKPGDYIEGMLIGKEEGGKFEGSMVYRLNVDGEEFVVFGTAVLNTKMQNVPFGKDIKIQFDGTQKGKAGQNDIKLFSVFVAE